MIKKTLRHFGLEVHRYRPKNLDYSQWMKNFENLSKGYEALFNKANPDKVGVIPNEIRPNLLARLRGTPPLEAYYLIQSLAETAKVKGDVCEFGVAQGETSAVIANEIGKLDKNLHLFDSFEGLPAPTEKDQLKDDIFNLGTIQRYKGEMKCPEDMVIERLNSIGFPKERVSLHKGFIEDLIHEQVDFPTQVSFAYVDFDFYEPTKIVLNFLDTKVSVGSVIMIDDYDFFSTGVKSAVDEFVQERDGQGIHYAVHIPDTHFAYCAILTRLN